MTLDYHETQSLLQRFPTFELSYETISHKKVAQPNYKLGLAISTGKKYYLWMTFDAKGDVCYLMELGKDRRVSAIQRVPVEFDSKLALGTVLYGTMTTPDHPHSHGLDDCFIVEDAFLYAGIPMKNMSFSEKLGIFLPIFSETLTKFPVWTQDKHRLSLTLPVMWCMEPSANDETPVNVPEHIQSQIGYHVHHIQLRDPVKITPYINLSTATCRTTQIVETAEVTAALTALANMKRAIPMDFSLPQFRQPTVFSIQADVQFDIYHLYAADHAGANVYCGVAAIPTYKTSILMNSLFRNIRENKNIDFIEESDDEDEFENTADSKHVDTEKVVRMVCTFHSRFKKWVPTKVAPEQYRAVAASNLRRLVPTKEALVY
jgi:hypothetical protein